MSKIVNLSEAASLAIHAMVIIARAPKIVNVIAIAQATSSSKNHLSKVMQRLAKEGFVRSTRGPLGGFELNKLAEEISLLDIYEAIEGPIQKGGCPVDKQICPFNKCLVGGIVDDVSAQIIGYLTEQKLSSYINRSY
ncbi:MAG: Rrf2 family transcriptional regulator [Bacteroidota bacterium]